MDTPNLKKFWKELVNCTQCGYCKDVCPVFDEVEWDSSVARGKMTLAYGLYQGDIEPDDSVIERLYQCTTCADCVRRCPGDTDVVEVVEAARKDLVAAGHATDIHKKILGSIKKYGNPFGEERSRSEVLGEEQHEAEIAYFTGCTAAFRNTATAKAGISILKKLGADYTILNESCCGSVLGRIGFPDEEIGMLANANLEAIKQTGAKTVLFSCAGCVRMFRKDYKKFGGIEFEALHFTEWLQNQDIKLKPYEKKITYHDPCHIGRHLGMYEAPRKVIEMIPGAEFVEMKNTKETSRCCGGGGGVRAGYPDVSRDIAAKRVEMAGIAEVLLTTCPFCVNNLKMGGEHIDSDVEVRDLLEVIDELLEE